ncbi:hypothetical protein [Nocardia sp. NPDC005825]|uniref:hypothetical protein n=1 Tax=unclassified Nocardia TaxID=2637762 RepID=UPI0033EBCEEF
MSDDRRAAPIYDFDRVKAGRDLSVSHTVNRFDVGVVSNGALLSGRSLYVSQVREFLAPVDGLLGRETELDDVAGFCRGDQPYMWIRAKPWAGKSALLSWFTLFPPSDVAVIGFFITDRLADQNDHTAFTAAVLDQLAVLLPDKRTLIATATINRDGLRNELLTLAARREADAGRRLVLVVDGLDEDTGTPPIVTLLPARPDPNLRVIVASRHGPTLPIAQRHPLARTEPYRLRSSPFAADIQRLALAELGALLRGAEEHRDLLALITAANGLTASELTDLTGLAPFQILHLLHAVAGRSLRTRSLAALAHARVKVLVFALAHETLQRTAEEQLGDAYIQQCLGKLHTWADRYRELGWPVDTPDFLLRRYFPVLEKYDDLPRMIALALDAARHDRMREHTGSDVTALAEIRSVQRRICDQPDPDLLSTARLARHRDNLHNRNDNIPSQLLTVLAILGQYERAEAIARSFSGLREQATALIKIAEVVAATDPDRAARLIGDAESIARAIPEPTWRDFMLAMVAVVAAAIDVDCAEAVVCTIADTAYRAQACAAVAGAVSVVDPDRAEAIGRAISRPEEKVVALVQIAKAVSATDPDRAAQLIGDAESIARTVPDLHEQARALTAVIATVAASDPDRAEILASVAADPGSREGQLVTLVGALAAADPYRAETLAHTITDTGKQAIALAKISAAVAATDPSRASQLTARVETLARSHQSIAATVIPELAASDPARAETLAYTLTDTYQRDIALAKTSASVALTDPHHAAVLARAVSRASERVAALADVAAVVATTDPDHARQIADQAETLAYTLANTHNQEISLPVIVKAVAPLDPDNAKALADIITGSFQRADALAALAAPVAAVDATRAEALAREISEPSRQVRALIGIAQVVMATDPACADRLADLAEKIARLISSTDELDGIRAALAAARAATDPDRAEDSIRTVTDSHQQAEALISIAKVVSAADPERAARLIDRAETVARTIAFPDTRAEMLGHIAEVAAVATPDRAEAITRTITDPYWQAKVLVSIAQVVSEADPERAARLIDRAETVARTINDPFFEPSTALVRIATAVAAKEPRRAEAIARNIIHPGSQAEASLRVAAAVADEDPERASQLTDHAETIAGTIPQPDMRAKSFTELAQAATSGKTRKRFLALAWSVASWDTPIQALPAVDEVVLHSLVSDLINEHRGVLAPAQESGSLPGRR